jgi:hypothetical protein
MTTCKAIVGKHLSSSELLQILAEEMNIDYEVCMKIYDENA